MHTPLNAGSMKEPGSEPGNYFLQNRKKYIRNAIPLILGMALLFSCRKNDIEVINTLTGINQLPSQSARDIETIYTDSARIQLLIRAPLLNRYEDEQQPYYEFPEGLYVEFYGEEEEVDSRLTARYALFHEADELWEARDSVLAINREGEILSTDLLFWDQKKKLIYTDRFVKITTPDELIYGEGFEADQDFSDWKIKKVTGTIYVEQ